MASHKLFEPYALGPIELSNRVVMAPLTRSRATSDGVPKDMHVDYYRQRAGAGLIISEATNISVEGRGYAWTPGIYSDEQVVAWRKVTDAVHDAGGKIVLQLWHVGRVSHPDLQKDGQLPVAPSAIAPQMQAFTESGMKEVPTPRALEKDELPRVVEDYVKAARNAIAAGFDGVEIHGANGYLIDQFLRSNANQRTDEYGGSVENRMRFLLEVVEGVTQAIGSGKTGLRLSPINAFNSMKDEDPVGLSQTLAKTLSGHDLAYLHVIRSNIAGSEGQEHQKAVVAAFAEHYTGNVVLNCDFGGKEGSDTILNDKADAIAYGTTYIANPDLPERFKAGVALNEPNPKTFYTTEAEGYIDYPFMDESA